jgi:chloramphenicol 3-O-phosphotransferase
MNAVTWYQWDAAFADDGVTVVSLVPGGVGESPLRIRFRNARNWAGNPAMPAGMKRVTKMNNAPRK